MNPTAALLSFPPSLLSLSHSPHHSARMETSAENTKNKREEQK
jgi:hypothetical protein